MSPVAEGRAAYTGPQRLEVRVLDRTAATATGVDGLLVGVTPQANSSAKTTGTVRIGVDYDSFAEAYGGNYGLRLKLVRLPACALDTPQRAECASSSRCRPRTTPPPGPSPPRSLEAAVSKTGAQMLVAAVAGAGRKAARAAPTPRPTSSPPDRGAPVAAPDRSATRTR
ncbi:hypothetical protein V2I01_26905 [Micromonospora sp. BRA006-A]|nr:hypothetical protein [Micromonospora sp. BRA006-A]